LAQYTKPIHLTRKDVRIIMPIEYFNNLIEIFGAEKSRLDVSAMDGGAVNEARLSFALLHVASWCGFVDDI